MVTFFYLFAVTFFKMTTSGADLAKTIVPFLLGSVIGTLMGFYWGNSTKEEKPGTPPTPPTPDAGCDAGTGG